MFNKLLTETKKTPENGHGLGCIIKFGASCLEGRLLKGNECIRIHGGQADNGQAGERYCHSCPHRS